MELFRFILNLPLGHPSGSGWQKFLFGGNGIWLVTLYHTAHFFVEDGIDFPTTRGLVIIDPFPNVGTMLEGYIVASQQCNVPMQYVALLSDEQHAEWFNAHWHQDLVDRFQKGSLQVPGMERPRGDCKKILWDLSEFGFLKKNIL